MNILADAVRVTLGPKARTVVLERSWGAPIVINSGVIVAKEIELQDRFENMGAQMVREVAAKTSEVAGDGTTTATLLAACDRERGHEVRRRGMNPMDLKRGIDRAVEALVAELGRIAKPCATRTEIAQVGTISANNDASIGEMIAEAMEKVGREGVITVEDGKGLANELEVVEGTQFDRGYPLALLHQQSREAERGARGRAASCSTTRRSRRSASCCRCSSMWPRRASRCSSSPRRSRARRWRRWS